MCLMCWEIQKDRMKVNEVVRALREFVPPKEHEEELQQVIFDKYGVEAVTEAVFGAGFTKALEQLETDGGLTK